MEVPRLPLRTAASSALVPELVDPVRRRPARRSPYVPPDLWMPAARPPAGTVGYVPVPPPVAGLLVDVYC